MVMKKVVSLLLVFVMCVGACTAFAADFPKGPVEIVVPFAAGGGMDLLARAVQPYMAEKGIQTIVTNMPGGSSSIGSMKVMTSPADGYSILCSGIETIIAFNLGGVLETPIDDWCELGCLVYDSHIIIVPTDSPFTTLEDLVAYAKDHPGELNWAGISAKGKGEMSAMEFWKAADISLNYVPYESGTDTRLAVMGHHADVGMCYVSEAKPLLESGDVRALAVCTKDGSSMFPDVPTLMECGYNIDNGLHRGFFAPKDVPEDVQKILSDALKYAFDQEEFRKTIVDQCAFEAFYISPEEGVEAAKEYTPIYEDLFEIMMQGQ